MSTQKQLRVGAAAAFVMFGLACTDPVRTEDEGVQIHPRAAVGQVGQVLNFSVLASAGAAEPVIEVRDSSVLVVLGPLQVAGRQAGDTHVLVRAGSAVDSAAVAVLDPRMCTPPLTLHPQQSRIRVGQTVQLRVLSCGAVLTDYDFIASSAAVEVSEDGLVTARQRGTAVVTARRHSDPAVHLTAVIEVE